MVNPSLMQRRKMYGKAAGHYYVPAACFVRSIHQILQPRRSCKRHAAPRTGIFVLLVTITIINTVTSFMISHHHRHHHNRSPRSRFRLTATATEYSKWAIRAVLYPANCRTAQSAFPRSPRLLQPWVHKGPLSTSFSFQPKTRV